MKKEYCVSESAEYQAPQVEIIRISPSQIICGSNENIEEGGQQNWVAEPSFLNELF
ncbi:MAG: hypothetical protein IJQ35_09740 [Bacteroidales bacterium]|nr:hypothetical protein [Bacteroidales bacterium]